MAATNVRGGALECGGVNYLTTRSVTLLCLTSVVFRFASLLFKLPKRAKQRASPHGRSPWKRLIVAKRDHDLSRGSGSGPPEPVEAK